MVTEPVKPALDTVVLSPGTGPTSASRTRARCVLGASLDLFPSYAQRGSFAVTQSIIAATLEIFPGFSRLRLLRQWAGIVDVVHDSSPIIGPTPVPGLYINCGWGTGGFKAIPVGGWTLAHVLATGRSHELAEPFSSSASSAGASSMRPRRPASRTSGSAHDAPVLSLLRRARRERVPVRRHDATSRAPPQDASDAEWGRVSVLS